MSGNTELQALGNFSFLEDANYASELVDQATHLGLKAPAITDRAIYRKTQHLVCNAIFLLFFFGDLESPIPNAAAIDDLNDRQHHRHLDEHADHSRQRSA